MESGSGGNESCRGRKALAVTETRIRQMTQNFRTIELPAEVSFILQQGLAARLSTQAAHLHISLLECRSRIGSGPSDPFYALLDAHSAVQSFAESIFPGIAFHRLEACQDPLMPPECELAYMIQVSTLLIEELADICGQ